ncbi:MAG: alpha-amylase [Deltaproteobacteria bacterium]|nr:alpha-amylase [Deltaproteobacteria bacterium]
MSKRFSCGSLLLPPLAFSLALVAVAGCSDPAGAGQDAQVDLLDAGFADACSEDAQISVPPDSGFDASNSEPPGQVKLLAADGEVWAFQRRIQGQVTHGTCERIAVEVGETAFVATGEAQGFYAEIQLQPGANRIAAVCHGGSGETTRSPEVVWTVKLTHRPTARTTVNVEASGEIALSSSSSEPGAGATLVAYEWSAVPGNPAALQLASGGPFTSTAGSTLRLAAPAADGDYLVQLEVRDSSASEDQGRALVRVERCRARTVTLGTEGPWNEAATVVYGVLPPRFGDDAYQAVAGRLDSLADLGVNTLWIAPVTAVSEWDFGYEVTDHFALRSDWGSEADFVNLIEAAHARGLRVLLDFVPNHTSIDHRYFQHAQSVGALSPYWGLYQRDPAGVPVHYFDWERLPNLAYGNPEVERMMLEAFSHWVRRYDVDGFRVDVAWGVKERSTTFWPAWRAELKRLKPNLLLIAEATGREAWWFESGFDVAYDWTDELGQWAWREAFDDPSQTRALLTAALTNEGRGFSADAALFRFLNNNDTGERFLTQYGTGRYKAALALLLTLPGVPCLYTGDELGAEFEPYDDWGGPLDFADPQSLRPYVKSLIALRRSLSPLTARELGLLDAGPSQSLLAYLRGPAAGPQALVVLNFGASQQVATLRLPEGSALAGRSLVDRLDGSSIAPAAQGELAVAMPAHKARVLTLP